MWYECYAIGGNPNAIIFKFFTISSNNMANVRIFEVGATLAPLTLRPGNDVWYYSLEE